MENIVKYICICLDLVCNLYYINNRVNVYHSRMSDIPARSFVLNFHLRKKYFKKSVVRQIITTQYRV